MGKDLDSLDIPPSRVRKTLADHILVDGFHLVVDLERSHGCHMVCADTGKKYLDMYSYFSTCAVGHNHPGMMDREFQREIAQAAIENPANSDVYTEQFADFVETFARLAKPRHMKHMFFVSGGTLAVENAMKAAFDWKVQKNFKRGKEELGHQVIHFKNAFHGRSGYSLSVTNTSPTKTKYFPKFSWPRIDTPKLSFPITNEVLARVKKEEERAMMQIETAIRNKGKDIACLLVEPIQGEGGDNHFRKEFFERIEDVCQANNILFILDEVQTGFGTTGKMWGFEHLGVKPDIIAFGKKSQVCGIMASKRIDEIETNVFKVPSRINSTWGGNLADMVKSRRTLEIMKEEGLLQNATRVGAYFLKRLEELQIRYPEVSNARGRGCMLAFDLNNSGERNILLNKCWRNGLAILSCGERSIRMRPPLIISKEDVDEAIEKLEVSLKMSGLKQYHEFHHRV